MSDREQFQAGRWLRRHGVHDLALAPLVTARIAIRRRIERFELLTYFALAAVITIVALGQAVFTGESEPDQAVAFSLIAIGTGYALMNVITGVMFWWQRRDDQRIAHGLRQRVTRAEAPSLATVLGRRNLRSMAVLYGGGILVGAVSMVFATATDDRRLAGVFVAGTTVCLGLSVWLLTDVVRRPAIADDEPSLRVDDLLRCKDASRALMPYPAILAAVTAISATDGSPLLWMFLIYAAAAVVAWGFTAAPVVRAALAAGTRP
jgi:hypothetical protein